MTVRHLYQVLLLLLLLQYSCNSQYVCAFEMLNGSNFFFWCGMCSVLFRLKHLISSHCIKCVEAVLMISVTCNEFLFVHSLKRFSLVFGHWLQWSVHVHHVQTFGEEYALLHACCESGLALKWDEQGIVISTIMNASTIDLAVQRYTVSRCPQD